jgi:energy-coupling factor transporter ATP-binding protein EcfA2
MVTSVVIIVLSLAMFVYWFRYSCILILESSWNEELAAVVAKQNELSFGSVEESLAAAESAEDFDRVMASLERIAKVIVGQQDVIDGVLICLLAGGHVLLEGVPGLGKTTLLRTLSRVLHLRYSRIQFTPDLMPADIVGSMVMETGDDGHKSLRFQPGPIFSNLVLADEINRATPKTQSALLEAMQERTVTSGRRRTSWSAPFLVMATQNPIEMEGTYPLPEAQLDRFLMKILVDYPSREELNRIVERTIAAGRARVEPGRRPGSDSGHPESVPGGAGGAACAGFRGGADHGDAADHAGRTRWRRSTSATDPRRAARRRWWSAAGSGLHAGADASVDRRRGDGGAGGSAAPHHPQLRRARRRADARDPD